LSVATSKCDQCGEAVTDLDAGFSPGLHEMGHACGGTWRAVSLDDDPEERHPPRCDCDECQRCAADEWHEECDERELERRRGIESAYAEDDAK
jgi:hypothetical protein